MPFIQLLSIVLAIVTLSFYGHAAIIPQLQAAPPPVPSPESQSLQVLPGISNPILSPIVSASPIPPTALVNVFNGVNNVAVPTPTVPLQSILASVSGNAAQILPTLSVPLQAAVTSVLGNVGTGNPAINSANIALPTGLIQGVQSAAVDSVLGGVTSNVLGAVPAPTVSQLQPLVGSAFGIVSSVLSAAPTAVLEQALTSVVSDINDILPTSCVGLVGYVVQQAGQFSTLITVSNTCQTTGLAGQFTPIAGLLPPSVSSVTVPISSVQGGLLIMPTAVPLTSSIAGQALSQSGANGLTGSPANLTAVGIVAATSLGLGLTSSAPAPPSASSTCANVNAAATDIPAKVDSGTGLLFRASCGTSAATVAQCPFLCSQAGGGAFKQCSNTDLSGQETTGQFPPIICTRCLPPCQGPANASAASLPPASVLNNSSNTLPTISAAGGNASAGPIQPTVAPANISSLTGVGGNSLGASGGPMTSQPDASASNGISAATSISQTPMPTQACVNAISSTQTAVAAPPLLAAASFLGSTTPAGLGPATLVPPAPIPVNGQLLSVGTDALLIPLIKVQVQPDTFSIS